MKQGLIYGIAILGMLSCKTSQKGKNATFKDDSSSEGLNSDEVIDVPVVTCPTGSTLKMYSLGYSKNRMQSFKDDGWESIIAEEPVAANLRG